MPKIRHEEDPDISAAFELVVKGFEQITDLVLRRAILEDLKRDKDSAAAFAVASAPRRRQLP